MVKWCLEKTVYGLHGEEMKFYFVRMGFGMALFGSKKEAKTYSTKKDALQAIAQLGNDRLRPTRVNIELDS